MAAKNLFMPIPLKCATGPWRLGGLCPRASVGQMAPIPPRLTDLFTLHGAVFVALAWQDAYMGASRESLPGRLLL